MELSLLPTPRVLLLLVGGAPKQHSGEVTVTLLCLYRDASPADLLPASAAEFPVLIPCSGSSLTLSSQQLRCEEARLSTQASWSLCHGGCDPLGAGWLRQLGLTLFPHSCRRGRSISQLGEAALHPAWCPQLSCNLCVAPLSQPGPGCTASLRTLGKQPAVLLS